MGSAGDPGVDRERFPPAYPLDHPLLEEAQQLQLERKRDVADLVEEKRAALSKLDLALRGLDRAGKGALFIAEQFGLEQAFGDGGPVDRDEGTAPPGARLLEADGAILLSGAPATKQPYRNGVLSELCTRKYTIMNTKHKM